jgi:uncharacterized metal-binding protein
MASYRSHVQLNVFVALPIMSYGLIHLHTPTIHILIFTGGFIFATLFLHPDVDLARKVKLFSWKGLATLPFRPYSYIVHHRGVSHWPLIGTIARLLWLVSIYICLSALFHWHTPSFNHSMLLWILASAISADLLHEFIDAATSLIRKK